MADTTETEHLRAEVDRLSQLLALAGYSLTTWEVRQENSGYAEPQPPTDVFIVLWNEASPGRPLAFQSFVGPEAWMAASAFHDMLRQNWSEVLLLAPIPPKGERVERAHWQIVQSLTYRRENEVIDMLERTVKQLEGQVHQLCEARDRVAMMLPLGEEASGSVEDCLEIHLRAQAERIKALSSEVGTLRTSLKQVCWPTPGGVR